jgi:hypothetical protein
VLVAEQRFGHLEHPLASPRGADHDFFGVDAVGQRSMWSSARSDRQGSSPHTSATTGSSGAALAEASLNGSHRTPAVKKPAVKKPAAAAPI